MDRHRIRTSLRKTPTPFNTQPSILLPGIATKPVTVLGETPGAWDSIYVCNAQVVGGSFTNPLGDDQTYAYAMYYVGTALHSGAANSIGVAFSNDGAHWKKYPRPVILTSTQEYYGVAQPAPYNSDRKSGIWLFYEDNNQPNGARHIEATSTDGVHFQTAGTLTTNGMNRNFPSASWGDIAYDPVTNDWYAVFNMNVRAPSTTGNHVERGQLGVTFIVFPASLLTGATHGKNFIRSTPTELATNRTSLPGFCAMRTAT